MAVTFGTAAPKIIASTIAGQVRFQLNDGKGSRVVRLSVSRAREFAYELLAEAERTKRIARQTGKATRSS